MNGRILGTAIIGLLGVASAVAHAVPVVSWNPADDAPAGAVEKICRAGDALCTGAPRNNEFFSGYVLEGGYLTLSESARITLTYVGKEAGFRNQFVWDGATLFDAATPRVQGPGALATHTVGLFTPSAGGVLPFAFRINVGGSGPSGNFLAANGTGNMPDSQPNIAFFFGDAPASHALVAPGPGLDVPTSGTRVMLLLDDGCGFVGNRIGGCDDDHDDMLVEITVSAVPEPRALVLTLAGLLVMGAMISRRSQQR